MFCYLNYIIIHYNIQNWNEYGEPSRDMVRRIHFVLVDREDHRGDDTEMLNDNIE